MIKNIRYILIVSLLLSALSLSAQTRTITGVVTGTNKEPLIGATVISLSKTNQVGVTTNTEGEFSIKIAADVDEIEVSYVGFINKRVSIKGVDKIDVELEEDAQQVEEVVVVGYGKMRKSDITGSVTSVSINDIEAASTVSIQNLLQGRAAGVQITSGDAAPGSAVNIKIRGTSSLTGNSEPLYVVDGIIMNSVSQDISVGGAAGNNNFTQGQNGLVGVNPQDIANIEILKDASATAIYGSMGANGVVLITTKVGNSDRTKVQYNGSVTASVMANKRRMISLEDFATYMTEYKGTPYSIEGRVPIDWQDQITRTAISNNHRVSVSGRSDKTNYYISGGFMNNQGIVKGTSIKQGDIRLNLDQKLSDGLRVGTKTGFTYSSNSMVQGSDTRGNSNSGLIRQAIVFKPFDPTVGPADDESVDENGDPVKDPRAWFTDYRDRSREYRALSSVFIDATLSKSWNMRTSVGIDYRNKTRSMWFGKNLFQGAKENGIGSLAVLQALRINADHMFNYAGQFGKHRLDGTAGISISTTQDQTNGLSTSQFNGILEYETPGFIYGTKDDVMNLTKSSMNSLSGLARIIYSYDNRYVVTTTFRADGTSKFAPGNKFSYFPSFALAYRINEEKFMRNVETVSNLKLRLGWGTVGNQAVRPYQTLTTFGNTQYARPGGGYDLAIFRNVLPNRDLRWETTTTYNAGLDLGVLQNRVNLTVDVYQKNSTDLLQEINLTSITGYASMYVNRGSIRNRGLEVALDATVINKKDFSLSLSGNISLNRNKITDIGLPEGRFGAHSFKAMTGGTIGVGNYLKDYVNIFIEGRPVALFFGTRVDGILQQSDIDRDMAYRDKLITEADPNRDFTANPIKDSERMNVKGLVPIYGSKMPLAGDPNYYDANGDGKVDSGDKTIIGNPNPKFSYGFSIDMKYKEFFMNAVFNGVYGNQIVNANRLQEEDLIAGNGNITQRAFDNYYRSYSPSMTYPRLNYNGSQAEFNSMIVEDGSFLRFAALTIGYNFRMSKKWQVSNIGVNFTARNLLTITNYTGYDPEVSTFTNNPMKVAVDWASYPNNRSFTFGITLDF